MNIDKAIKIGFYIVLCYVFAGLVVPIPGFGYANWQPEMPAQET